MPNRDYAVRSKAKKGGNTALILAVIILLLMGSGFVLWFLKESNPTTPVMPTQMAPSQQPKSTLPTPPQEVYSYIRDLETREVPVDKNSKLAQLTKEQELAIQKQKEEQQLSQTATSDPVANTSTATEQKQEQQQEVSEEKPKQEQLPKTQEQAKNITTAKPASEQPKNVGKFGLQCGAFKNKAQAENMQARLAMAGYNARINSNGEWNRVVVGPAGDRAKAMAALSNARSVAECVIIGM
ncbi:SPOR domain-containing protein [Glaesserella parasuis]|uniref:Cell division protein FtsN n=1 Tax=Glaesserella parasuis HPS9 TaxID=1450513 RepID=A0A837AF59_GLAPU|nr:SPOR domain-containing protein [Glaesserella parasuis]AIK17600.1 cell division protein [Glaesserella parasuis]ATW46191.1 cell division protein FtsN [Glaesserella parasuis str. Nagasaki]AWY46284.1 cell division protein FtsN [Glaesserella parasuis 29755]EQA01449.1 cell division protein FtsN [Glaesserella parasuis str. Nagasaki]EQA94937.1 cell division protein FtsN [Glaesserella parasuis 29755]